MWALASVLIYSGCSDNEETSSETRLDSFGPTVLRGGELNFIGENLNNVTSIILPDGIEIPASSFKSKTSKLIVIDVPEEVVEGKVIINTTKGEIITKTELSIAEPITITSITPANARPGTEVTIEGTYLNLIEKVIFKDGKEVTSFVSQSKSSIKVIVPHDAQTGIVTVEDGENVPNVIESETELQVVLPAVTAIAPSPIKPGSNVTITGTNLDLTADVNFVGGTRVLKADFVSISATQIVVKVPANAKEGAVNLRPLSLVEVATPALQLVAPAITGIAPDPAKNGANITVTGTNLDLVNQVTFGGKKDGTIQAGGTATQIVVSVPADAKDGKVKFGAQSDKWDSTKTITLVKPTITSFTGTVSTINNPSITINGTDLDLVSSVKFAGVDDVVWVSKKITHNSVSQIIVEVTPGSISGKFKLVTTNTTEVESSTDLTIVPNVPNVTGPASANLGSMMILTGTNMSVISEIYFPNGKLATKFGAKTTTSIEVWVPDMGLPQGPGKMKFVTDKNEIYYSPVIEFRGVLPLPVTLYDDAIAGGGGNWSWASTPDSNVASNEQFYLGNVSWKFVTTGEGGLSAGGISPVDVTSRTYFSFSLFGGPGTDGAVVACILNDKWDSWNQVTLVEGKWTEYKVPLSGYPTVDKAAIVRFAFKVNSQPASTIYADRVGFE